MDHPDTILIVDFGSQVTQLIARRVREAGVYSEIAPFTVRRRGVRADAAQGHHPVGRPGLGARRRTARARPQAIFEAGLPMLGICYGQQVMMHAARRHGRSSGDRGEFGRAFIEVERRLRAVRRAVGRGRAASGVDEPWRQGRPRCRRASRPSPRQPGAPFAVIADEARRYLRRPVPPRGGPHPRRRQADRQFRAPRLRAGRRLDDGRVPRRPRSPRSARRSATAG